MAILEYKNGRFEKMAEWLQILQIVGTPTPWLTRIRFTQISLTRLFKRVPFLT